LRDLRDRRDRDDEETRHHGVIRAPQPEDADAIAKLVIASDIAEIGEPDYTLEDLHDEWAARDFDLATDAVVLEAGGKIVGYAAFRGSETLLIVDPARLGEGFGSALRAWAEDRAREKGLTTIRQDVGDRNAAAREHLTDAGYERERSYWRMELELENAETPPHPPKGFAIRTFDAAADAHALYVVSEAAFAGNADYRPETETHFTDEHLHAHNFRPDLSVVAEQEGRVAGFALVRDHGEKIAYVDLLAVHPDSAGKGLGSALLRTAYAGAAQAGFRSGRLGVASDNPNAIRLYARVGMTQRWRVDSYARAL
jgi:mycothiol synthase